MIMQIVFIFNIFTLEAFFLLSPPRSPYTHTHVKTERRDTASNNDEKKMCFISGWFISLCFRVENYAQYRIYSRFSQPH